MARWILLVALALLQSSQAYAPAPTASTPAKPKKEKKVAAAPAPSSGAATPKPKKEAKVPECAAYLLASPLLFHDTSAPIHPSACQEHGRADQDALGQREDDFP